MRLLVVEDDTVLADALTHTLRAQGYAVDCMTTGSEADRALTDEEYDGVVLDIELPVNAGVGPPMTYMFEGKQYIAVMGGTGAQGRGGRGQQEATAAAAKGNVPAPAPLTNNNPKLMIYAVPSN